MPHTALTAALALPPGRHLIAIAGAPASGKSTLAEHLSDDLNRQGRSAVVVPMDGFHLDDRILVARGDLPRKGAPHTFDAAGLYRLLSALKAGESAYYPVFDRSRELAIAGAGQVSAQTDLVIVEGNYLLFDHPDWRDLAALWSLAIQVDVPEPELRTRLMQRWRDHGLSEDQAARKTEENDLPNTRIVLAHRLPADLTLT